LVAGVGAEAVVLAVELVVEPVAALVGFVEFNLDLEVFTAEC